MTRHDVTIADVAWGLTLKGPSGVIEAMSGLPEAIKPETYSSGEDEPQHPLRDSSTEAFLAKQPNGGFLFSRSAMYDVQVLPDRVDVSAYWGDEAGATTDDIGVLFSAFAEHCDVLFGFAADDAEREHRNRVVLKVDGQTIEAWVGRDCFKAIPGFYWQTIVGDELARVHGLDIAKIAGGLGARHERLAGKASLLRLYPHPSAWREEVGRVDSTCSKLDGVFSRHDVDARLEGAKGVLGVLAALKAMR